MKSNSEILFKRKASKRLPLLLRCPCTSSQQLSSTIQLIDHVIVGYGHVRERERTPAHKWLVPLKEWALSLHALMFKIVIERIKHTNHQKREETKELKEKQRLHMQRTQCLSLTFTGKCVFFWVVGWWVVVCGLELPLVIM